MKRYLPNTVLVVVLLSLSLPLPGLSDAPPKPVLDSFQQIFQGRELPAFLEVKPDLYQFIVDGRVFYLSEDGKLLFAGQLWDVANEKDLSEIALRRFRRETIEALDARQILTYAPPGYRYTVNVFTDIDCSYCRKFHQHLPELRKLGIRVNYLLTPMRGAESRTKAVSVWCSADRNRAMDMAKRGGRIPEKSCDHPVEEHLRISRLLGVRGTPMLVLENGSSVNGYLPPEQLIEALVEDAASP